MSEKPYKPQQAQKRILDTAWELVQSVPYRVGLRWVFYGLLQRGLYSQKEDYKKWCDLCSKARRRFYEGWRPDTLADETRDIIWRGVGHITVRSWIQHVANDTLCVLDKWQHQDFYVQLWYEARAMTGQFEHYTDNIALVPMGGQPSIEHKWNVAKSLEQAHSWYQSPIVVIYFGDLDDAGKVISDVVERDVREWCSADFEFIQAGLTLEQAQQYNVPENPEKPGQYQWEALSDQAAREVITSATDQFVWLDRFSEVERQEQEATNWLSDRVLPLSQEWKGRF